MRISIITPTLNANQFVAEAIESVLAQRHPDIEHIVVDGGSTDGTLDTLRRYPHLRVVVEPALGLYPALNRGIAQARGEVIGLINADDRYCPGAVASAVSRLAEAPDADCASGGARVMRVVAHGGGKVVREYGGARHKLLDWDPLLFGAPIINARFFRKAFIERTGDFDTDYKIAADREWLIRAKLAGMRIVVLAPIVYEYREHVGSLTINPDRTNIEKISDEHLAIIYRYLNDPRAHAVMERWQAWEAGRKIMRHLAHGRIEMAYRAANQARSESLLWLPRFLAELPNRIAARLAN